MQVPDAALQIDKSLHFICTRGLLHVMYNQHLPDQAIIHTLQMRTIVLVVQIPKQ